MMIDTVREYLEAEEWPITRIGGDTAYSTTFQGRNGRWPVIVKTEEDSGLLIIWSQCPVKLPAARAATIGLLAAQINYRLQLGNFEYDDREPDMRFRTSLRSWNSSLSAVDFAVLLQHAHQRRIVHGRERMVAHARLGQKHIADEQIALIDGAAVGGKRGVEHGEVDAERVTQRVGDRPDVTRGSRVEGGAVLEVELACAGLPQPVQRIQ